MFTHHCHSGTTSKQWFRISIHVTDQRMVTQSFKYGVKTSLILVTISDATLVPEVQRPTSYPAHSCGADQPSLKSLARLSHSPSHWTDSRTRHRTLNSGTTTIQKSKSYFQILDQLPVVLKSSWKVTTSSHLTIKKTSITPTTLSVHSESLERNQPRSCLQLRPDAWVHQIGVIHHSLRWKYHLLLTIRIFPKVSNSSSSTHQAFLRWLHWEDQRPVELLSTSSEPSLTMLVIQFVSLAATPSMPSSSDHLTSSAFLRHSQELRRRP